MRFLINSPHDKNWRDLPKFYCDIAQRSLLYCSDYVLYHVFCQTSRLPLYFLFSLLFFNFSRFRRRQRTKGVFWRSEKKLERATHNAGQKNRLALKEKIADFGGK